MATTTTVYVDEDTWLDGENEDDNYSSSATMTLGQQASGFSSGERANGVLKFDLSAFSDASLISSATFKLAYAGGAGGSGTRSVYVYRLTQHFTEDEATWNVASAGEPWDGASPGGASDVALTEKSANFVVGFRTDDDKSVDITELIQDAILRRDGILWIWIGIPLSDIATSTAFGNYHSLQATLAADRPQLEIVTADRIAWNGSAGDGNADTAANWDGGTEPTALDHALFNSGSEDISSGGLYAGKVIIGRNYRGNIGASGSLLTVATFEVNIDNRHSNIYINTSSVTPVCQVRINDTNSTGNFKIDGYYTAIVRRSRHTLLLDTEDVARVDVGRNASINCTADVDTVVVSGGRAILDDAGGEITATSGGYVEISVISEDSANVKIAGNSNVRMLGNALDTCYIYNGALDVRGNEEATIQFAMEIHRNGEADTRTGSANYIGDGAGTNYLFGGRLLLDGSQKTTIT